MPELPSGIKLALNIDHILVPDLNWFKAPEGHFWYSVPDPEINSPPFAPQDEWLGSFVTAPVPQTIDEIKQYVHVCIGLPNRMMYWRGESMLDFPKYAPLSAADLEAWQQWLTTDRVTEYLEKAIARCKLQSEVNKKASGYAVMRTRP